MKYTSPKYELALIETSDIMSDSPILIDPETGVVLTEETDTMAKISLSIKKLFKFSD